MSLHQRGNWRRILKGSVNYVGQERTITFEVLATRVATRQDILASLPTLVEFKQVHNKKLDSKGSD